MKNNRNFFDVQKILETPVQSAINYVPGSGKDCDLLATKSLLYVSKVVMPVGYLFFLNFFLEVSVTDYFQFLG